MIGDETDDKTPDEDVTIGDLLSRLVDDTEQFVRAEFSLYRAQAVRGFSDSRAAVGMALGGVVILQAAIIALLVGTIIALEPVVGGLWATVIVIIVSVFVAALLLSAAWRKLKSIIFAGGTDNGGD